MSIVTPVCLVLRKWNLLQTSKHAHAPLLHPINSLRAFRYSNHALRARQPSTQSPHIISACLEVWEHPDSHPLREGDFTSQQYSLRFGNTRTSTPTSQKTFQSSLIKMNHSGNLLDGGSKLIS